MRTITEYLIAIKAAEDAGFFYTARAMRQLATRDYPVYPWPALAVAPLYNPVQLPEPKFLVLTGRGKRPAFTFQGEWLG